MKILETTNLTDVQKQEIKQLLKKVHQEDQSYRDPYLSNQFNNFPEMPCFFLSYEEGVLIGFIMIYADGTVEEPVEVYINVLPAKRLQGIASSMLKHVHKTLKKFGYKDIEYVTEKNFLQKNPDFLNVTRLKLVHKEHQLRANEVPNVAQNQELIVKPLQEKDIKQVIPFEAKAFEVTSDESEKYISESYNDSHTLTYVLKHGSNLIGYCAIDNGTEYYIFDLVISQSYRTHGYGTFFVKKIMSVLDNKQHKPFVLGVDDDNLAARHLYANAGFIEETEIEYFSKI